MRKEEIKERLRRTYSEITHEKSGKEMADLEEKARGIFRFLDAATSLPMLDRVETGILSLQNDLNRAAMDYR